jgi:hypothetical protein
MQDQPDEFGGDEYVFALLHLNYYNLSLSIIVL